LVRAPEYVVKVIYNRIGLPGLSIAGWEIYFDASVWVEVNTVVAEYGGFKGIRYYCAMLEFLCRNISIKAYEHYE